MGRQIRKGSLQHRMIERRMQAFFADTNNAERDPDTGMLVVKDADTFRRAADHVSGRDPQQRGTGIIGMLREAGLIDGSDHDRQYDDMYSTQNGDIGDHDMEDF